MLLRRYATILLLAAGAPALLGCESQASLNEDVRIDTTLFGGPEALGLLAYDPIREASGLVASRKNPGVLWAHNDSGDEPRLFAFTPRGEHLGVYRIDGARARDWEDLALGPGPDPDRDYLYIGDIGDNEALHDRTYVYRVPEPTVAADQAPVDTTLTGTETITLRYPNGPFDAETLLLDPATRALYVITKRSTVVDVYRADYPPSTTDDVEMTPVTTLTFDLVPGLGPPGQGAVGGDVSPSGLEVLVKTYTRVYYWRRASVADDLFAGRPVALPYVPEPQGEAIAWAADGSGYYTVSEETYGVPATVYFYPRLSGAEADR